MIYIARLSMPTYLQLDILLFISTPPELKTLHCTDILQSASSKQHACLCMSPHFGIMSVFSYDFLTFSIFQYSHLLHLFPYFKQKVSMVLDFHVDSWFTMLSFV